LHPYFMREADAKATCLLWKKGKSVDIGEEVMIAISVNLIDNIEGISSTGREGEDSRVCEVERGGYVHRTFRDSRIRPRTTSNLSKPLS